MRKGPQLGRACAGGFLRAVPLGPATRLPLCSTPLPLASPRCSPLPASPLHLLPPVCSASSLAVLFPWRLSTPRSPAPTSGSQRPAAAALGREEQPEPPPPHQARPTAARAASAEPGALPEPEPDHRLAESPIRPPPQPGEGNSWRGGVAVGGRPGLLYWRRGRRDGIGQLSKRRT